MGRGLGGVGRVDGRGLTGQDIDVSAQYHMGDEFEG